MPLQHHQITLHNAQEAASSPWGFSETASVDLRTVRDSAASSNLSAASVLSANLAAHLSEISTAQGVAAGSRGQQTELSLCGGSDGCLPRGGVVVEDVTCSGLQALVQSLVDRASNRCVDKACSILIRFWMSVFCLIGVWLWMMGRVRGDCQR